MWSFQSNPMLDLILSNLNLVLGGLGALAIGFIAFFVRKSGADAEKAKQVKADQKALEAVYRAKTDAAKASDDDLSKLRDKWTRP